MLSFRQYTVIIHPITGLNWKQASQDFVFRRKPENGQDTRDSQTSNQECPMGNGHEFTEVLPWRSSRYCVTA